MSKILRYLACFFAFGFIVNSAFAAGYTCPTVKKYTSCSSGYYISNCPTSSSSWTGQTIAESALTTQNSCKSCPTGYTCSGGMVCPKADTVTVTYNWNGADFVGGSAPATSKSCTKGASCSLFSTSTAYQYKAGHVWVGWSTDSTCESSDCASWTITTSTAETVYAVWQPCAVGYYKPGRDTTNSAYSRIACQACPNGGTTADTGTGAIGSCYKTGLATYTATYGSGTQSCYYTSGSGTSATYTTSCFNKRITSCDATYYRASTTAEDCITAGDGYWSAAGSVSRTLCPSGYRDGAATDAQDNCYAEKTKTGNQNDGATPDNCYSVTEWNSCTPGTCTYKDYYNATDTTCTPDDCTKTAKKTTGKSGFYGYSDGNGGACSACPSGYDDASDGTSTQASCAMNVSAKYHVANSQDSSATQCDDGQYKKAHVVYYGYTSSCSACTNKPSYSSYTGPGSTETNCPWECDDGYNDDDNNGTCEPNCNSAASCPSGYTDGPSTYNECNGETAAVCYRDCETADVDGGHSLPQGNFYYGETASDNSCKVGWCNPGYYMDPTGYGKCYQCPSGWRDNPSKDDAGKGYMCQRDCTTDDVSNSSAVSGLLSYDGSYNTCAATSCSSNYWVCDGDCVRGTCPSGYRDGGTYYDSCNYTQATACYYNCTKDCTQQACPSNATCTHGSTSKSGQFYYGGSCNAPASSCSISVSCNSGFYMTGSSTSASATCTSCTTVANTTTTASCTYSTSITGGTKNYTSGTKTCNGKYTGGAGGTKGSGSCTGCSSYGSCSGGTLSTVTCEEGYYKNASNTCTKCEGAYYCPGGTYTASSSIAGRNSCPSADSGWTAACGTGCTTYTQCYEYQTPSNCSSGSVKRAASSTTAYSSTISVRSALSASPGYRVSGTACSVCSSGTWYGGGTATSCNTCPTATSSSWSVGSDGGRDEYGDCYETIAATTADSNCYGGSFLKRASSASAWGTTQRYTATADEKRYVSTGSCPSISNGQYSANGNSTTTTDGSGACTNKPSYSTYTGPGSTSTNCPYSYNVYTITLNDSTNSGSGGSGKVYEKYNTGYSLTNYGTAVTSVTKPTRSGYTFRGYYTAASGGTQRVTSAGALPSNTTFTSNTTLYAQFCQNCASVSNGSCSLSVATNGTCTYTTSCNTGYTISGNGTATPTCTAKCNAITLDHDGNGGSADATIYKKTGSTTYYSNSSCSTTITTITKPTKSNATYAGSYTSSGNSGGTQCITSAGALSTSTSCNVTGSTTWYSRYTCGTHWTGSGTTIAGACTRNVYAVTLNDNGGSGGSGTVYQKYATGYSLTNYGTAVTSVTKPTRSGYTFRGYYSADLADVTSNNSSGTQRITKAGALPSNTTFTGATTVYAAWAKNCTVPSNGSCSLSVTDAGAVTYTTSCNTGYTISGNGTATPTCTANTLTINFDDSGATSGSADPTSKTCSYNGTCTAAARGTLYNSSKVFKGWSKTEGSTTVSYAEGASIKNIISSGSITLYPVWQTVSCTATKGTCGTVSVNSSNVPSATVTCNTGYSASGGTNTTSTVTATGVAGATSISGICKARTWTVSYAANSGSGNAPTSPTGCTYDATCTAPSNTYSRTGYYFAGWKCTGGNSACDGDTIAAGGSLKNVSNGSNITLTAQWTVRTDIKCSSTGQYLPKNSVTCSACPKGYKCTNATSVAYTFSTSADQGLTACSGTNEYQDTTGQTTCKAVTDGYYKNGNTAIQVCGTGYYCKSGARNQCSDSGTTATTTASLRTECFQTCSASTDSSVPGIASGRKYWTGSAYGTCKPVSTTSGCHWGYRNDNGETCTRCPAGSWCYNAEHDCPAGYFCAGGNYDPTYADYGDKYKCAIGSWSAAGSSACTPCGGGKTTTGVGTTSSNSCTSCTAIANIDTWATPTWSNNTVANLCTVSTCKAGAFKTGNTCPLCAKGSYSGAAGATSCTACQNGLTTSGTGQTSCNADCINKNVNVKSWKSASWTNNSVTNSCVVNECQACANNASANCSMTAASTNACTATTTCKGGYYSISGNGQYNASCSVVGDGYWSANTSNGRTHCNTLTGVSVSGGTYSTGTTTASANTACKYTAKTPDTPSNCKAITVNTVTYTGSAWPTSTFNVTAKAGAYVSATNVASPTCTPVAAGRWSTDGNSLTSAQGSGAVTAGYYCGGGAATATPTSTSNSINGKACGKCSALASGFYPNSAAGSDAASDCYTNSISGAAVTSANASSATDCDPGYAKAAHNVYYGSTSSCSACTGATYAENPGQASCDVCPTATKYASDVSSYGSDDKTKKSKCYVYFKKSSSDNGTFKQLYCYYNTTDKDYATDNSACGLKSTTCKAGYYSPVQNTTSWVTATGYDATIARACIDAGTGYWSATDSVTRTQCPANYREGAAASAEAGCALKVDAGTYVKTAAAGQEACPANSYCVGGATIYYGTAGGTTTGGSATCSSGTSSKYTLSAASSDNIGDCYLNTSAGSYVKTASAGQQTCEKGSYCPGSTKVFYNSNGGTPTTGGIAACATGSYTDTTGKSACTACQNGVTTSGTGKTSCDATCSNKTNNVKSWTTATWAANSVTNACTISACQTCAATKANCSMSLSGNKCTATTSCQGGAYNIQNNGYYNASCSDVGIGYWSSNGSNSRAQCDAPMTTIGFGAGADEAADCGRILHVGSSKIYLRSVKKTTPSLNVRVDGTVYYGNMGASSGSGLKIKSGGTTYKVYDDTIGL